MLRECLEYSSYSINDGYYLLVHAEKQQYGKACSVWFSRIDIRITGLLLVVRLLRIGVCLCSVCILGFQLQSYSFIILVSFLYTYDFMCAQGGFKSGIRTVDFLKSKIVNNRKYCCYFRNWVLYQLYFVLGKNRNLKNLLTSYFFLFFSFFFPLSLLLGARGVVNF